MVAKNCNWNLFDPKTLIKLSRLVGVSFKSWKQDCNIFSKAIHLHQRWIWSQCERCICVNYSYQSRSIQEIQVFLSVLSISSKASGLHLVHPSTAEPFLLCQRLQHLHEQSPVNADGWYDLKTWSSSIYLQLCCSSYSIIEGRCPF